MFFIDQPEILNTINVIPGFLYKNFPIIVIIGASFIFLFFIFLFLKNKRKRIKNNFSFIIIFLISVFWVPLYINYFFINIFDLKENFRNNGEQGREHKHILRLCRIDNLQNINGLLCKIYPFSAFIKENLPPGANVRLLSHAGLEPYFYYNIYPRLNFVYDFFKADYVIMYFPDDYIFKDNILYYRDKFGKENPVGEFSIIEKIDNYRIILKKKKT